MSISDDDNLFEGNNDDEFNSKGPEEDTDFYAVLNVPRDATIEDINRAYKQRSLIFHPDRHTDEQDKREAAKIFCLLKKAHETLTDPQLRAIYDTIGIQGINLEGWQLVSRSTNPENIRREYEFLSRLRETEIMMERIHPTNSFVFRASIAGLFQADEDEWFSILGMNLAQGVDCGFTGVDRVGLAGRVRFNERGLGDGSVQFSYKRPISASTHLENFFTLSPNQLSFSSKASLPLLPSFATDKWLSWFKGSTLMLQPTVQYNTTNESFNLSLVPVAFFPLGPNFQGALQFNLGLKQYAAMTVSFAYLELNHPKFLLNLTISPLSPTLRLAYHLRYPQNEQHYETSCVLSLTEITPSITLERRLTKYSKVGLQLLFSYPSFLLQANFRIKAGLSNYEFRFVFCEQQDDFARAALYGIILPGLVLNATRLMFRPYFSQLMRIFEGRNIDEAVVEARKEQAQKAVHLMRETAEKVAREEERKKGLIIVEAQYGEMVNDTPGYELYPVAGERLIDVTIPLQALVNDSQLRIYSGKTQIPGFYDPCVGEPKMLKVIYRFHDKLHAICIPEDQPLMIPMREHCIVDGRQ